MSRRVRSREQVERVASARILAGHFTQRGKPKRSFETREEARAFADEINARSGEDPKAAYRCSLCHRFHVGS